MFVDIIIILFLISAVLRGRDIGLVRQVFSTVGFFGGLFLGAWIEPHVVGLAHTALSRSLLTLVTTLGCGLLLLSAGEYVGEVLKSRLRRLGLNRIDIVLGAVAGGLTLLLTVWLVAPVLESLPFPGLQQAVRSSFIVSELDTTLPPAPNVIADLGHVIYPNGFPEVFTGLEPTPPGNVKLPNLGSMNAAVQKDKASIVKIEGQGCGGLVQGTGFVIANNLVATNAHVIAGVNNPVVFDGNGEHRSTPIWFDPNLDFALLSVNHLAGKPLVLDTARANSGTPGVVLGYPGDGNLSAQPASVLNEFTATGRNIYNQGATNRQVLEIKATVRPGNSGGPLVEKNGSVTGIVFAESATYNQIGYALAMQQVVNELHQAEASNTPVGTGACAE